MMAVNQFQGRRKWGGRGGTCPTKFWPKKGEKFNVKVIITLLQETKIQIIKAVREDLDVSLIVYTEHF